MKRDPKTRAPDFYAFARDYLHSYLPAVQRRSPNTIDAYRISLECLLGYLADQEGIERAKVTFELLDRQHLKRWLAWMSEQRHYAPRTIALRLTAVKAFLEYCANEEITLVAESQAARSLHAPATPRKPIEYLTAPQTRALLAAPNGDSAKSRRNRMLLILLYDTAARVGEITSLTLQNLSLQTPAHVTLNGKGDNSRVVPLTAKTIEHLRVYLAEFHPDTASPPAAARPLFYSLHHGHPASLSADTVAAVLKAAAVTARRSCPSIPENIHCHMLRKTKAMDLYQQGIPMPIIMRLLGHQSMSTTTTFYAFATLDMMRAAVNAATPAADPPPEPLTEQTLQALSSLR
ncbi:MAG: tyrosine-type recombinase/integrase [Solirubrobacteraceae bacterium]